MYNMIVSPFGDFGAGALDAEGGGAAAAGEPGGPEAGQPYRIPLDESGAPVGGHTSGTAKGLLDGAEPNSVYTQTKPNGTPVQNTIYDGNGDSIGHFDFKDHGTGGPHGHAFDTPGDPFSAHGRGAPHIPPSDLPPGWDIVP